MDLPYQYVVMWWLALVLTLLLKADASMQIQFIINCLANALMAPLLFKLMKIRDRETQSLILMWEYWTLTLWLACAI